MRYLNLTEGFDPLGPGGDNIKFEKFTFNGGEPHIKIEPLKANTPIAITTRINTFEDLGLLIVAVNALKGMFCFNSTLYVPYFPGARQDRRMVEGEPLTVKVYADIINDMEFKGVIIYDPHSDVTPALINNCRAVTNHRFVKKTITDIESGTGEMPILISPDAGSNKKVGNLAKYIMGKDIAVEVVKCDKTRDIETGKITDFVVYAGDLKGRDCLIVDDICDGGGTFLGLADELVKHNAGNLYLATTHGIFSHGVEKLKEKFTTIITTDSIHNSIEGVEVTKLNSL